MPPRRAAARPPWMHGALEWRVGGGEGLARGAYASGVAGSARSALLWARAAARDALLPAGYPSSVSADYGAYQAWDTLQALCSYARGALTARALLGGLGVGAAGASALGAAAQWVLRDLTGLAVGLGVGACAGADLDARAKQWRLSADVLNDAAMLAELAAGACAPAGAAFAFAAAARATVGVAAGATKAALTYHFSARHRNAADVAAKEGAQETLATLVGGVLGLLLLHATEGSVLRSWMAFLLLTLVHVWANVRAMRALCLTSLNQHRLAGALALYSGGAAPSPAAANAREPLLGALPPLHALADTAGALPPPLSLLLPLPAILCARACADGKASMCERVGVRLGVRLEELRGVSAVMVVPPGGGPAYALGVCHGPPRTFVWALQRLAGARCSTEALVALPEGADDALVLRAYTHALKAAAVCHDMCAGFPSDAYDAMALGEEGFADCEYAAIRASVVGYYAAFARQLAAEGWDLDRLSLPLGAWRVRWDERGKAD
eukprot:PRCOL_00005711-RA